MSKVLIAVEDYSELIFLETLFKKVGLDVEGLQNDVAVPEKLLGFNPDLLILSSYGARVSPSRLLPKVKRSGGYPRIIVLYHKGRGTEKDLKAFAIDALIESPVHPRQILQATERLLGYDDEILLRKMERTDQTDRSEDNKLQHIKSKPAPRFPLKGGSADGEDENEPIEISAFREANALTPEQLKKKAERYKTWSESEYLPPFQRIGRDRVAAIEKNWRETENDPEIQDIDEERRQFAKELFKKNRG
ncbi:MAG TPA: hypothetical protein VFV50_06130 [Bdellovibrionales bacterium]|nr:hypothetical protein [Bdellovibrionales bacterium]